MPDLLDWVCDVVDRYFDWRWALLGLVLSGAVQCTAQAQCAPQVTESRHVLMHRGGQPGVWFQIDVADCMLRSLEEARELQSQVRILEDQLQLWPAQETDLRTALYLAVGERDSAVGALVAAERARRAAEASRDHWSRSPAVWVTVGAILGLTASAIAVQALGG